MNAATESNFWAPRTQILLSLHEIFFSLNIATALAYGAALFIARNTGVEFPDKDYEYYYFCGVVRLSDLLRVSAFNSVSTSVVGRTESILWSPGIIVLAFLITVVSIAAVIYLFLKIAGSRSRIPFWSMAGTTALFAAPICCLIVWQMTSNLESQYSTVRAPFGPHVLIEVLAGELVVFFALFARKRPIPSSWSGVLLFVHSAFWSVVLFPNFVFYIGMSQLRSVLHFIVWVIPSVGAASLLYVWPGSEIALPKSSRPGALAMMLALLGATALVAIWMPVYREPPLQVVGDQAALLELSRGPCYGPCPVYTVKIKGDGHVEFEGQKNVKVKGKQTGQITQAQFAEIVRILQRIRFWSLEDRAFRWCFDTPAVAISVKLNGKEKRVSSDAACIPKAGLQADFVQASDEIESVVGTDRWIKCDSHYCR